MLGRDDLAGVTEMQRTALRNRLPRCASLGFDGYKFMIEIRDLTASDVDRIAEFLRRLDDPST